MIALRSRLKTSILISAVGLMISPATDLRAQEAKRSIEQVKGDVYRFQNDFHFAMFVVTDDGIVVTDPINADAVNWLKAELADRFDQPVTHMVLSHSHATMPRAAKPGATSRSSPMRTPRCISKRARCRRRCRPRPLPISIRSRSAARTSS